MKKFIITESSLSLSTYYLRMISLGSDEPMSTATGFLYEYKDEIFLITNGHNITRINPETNERLGTSAAFPVRIRTMARVSVMEDPDLVTHRYFTVDLYSDDDYRKPKWFIHPDHGYSVDVVAIPLEKKSNIPDHVKLFPINNFPFDKRFPAEVADDVFVLGYPFDMTGEKEFPIWKRGTIATEPLIDIGGLPKMYIDTATRSGMSGSPVIMRRTGIHGIENGQLTKNTILGLIQDFVGVYSGRIGGKNSDLNLGIVWKEHVIHEILKANVLGGIEFQSI